MSGLRVRGRWLAGKLGPDVGPALVLALRQVRHCCWNSADAGCKFFCVQSCGPQAVCTGKNLYVQVLAVGDGVANPRVCSEQAYARALDHYFDGCSGRERGTGIG